jgi:hypothetical protein
LSGGHGLISQQGFLVQAFVMNKITNATYPRQVMIGIEPAVVSPRRLEQSTSLVQTKGTWMNVQKFGGDTYCIEGSCFVGHPRLPSFCSSEVTMLVHHL